ncbi:hypothetical protein Scep_025763 [Stephania cephalantha]|uniref:Uncharacterized protein n=1 Tax=Stephania cephalantha TaxID=152367 RepID=A0AAP0EJA6_9MAGN
MVNRALMFNEFYKAFFLLILSIWILCFLDLSICDMEQYFMILSSSKIIKVNVEVQLAMIWGVFKEHTLQITQIEDWFRFSVYARGSFIK